MSDISTQRHILALEQQIERLRKADAGIPSGTSFPSSPPTGMQFFRTDFELPCVYDGTRWITTFHYHATNGSPIGVSATQTNLITPIRQDVAPIIDRITTEYIVQTTNNATNFYTIDIRGVSANYSAASILHTFDTKATAVNTWTSLDATPNVSNLPTNRAFFDFNIVKTLTPGTLSIMTTIYYRLILT